jgi:hypothetical protein
MTPNDAINFICHFDVKALKEFITSVYDIIQLSEISNNDVRITIMTQLNLRPFIPAMRKVYTYPERYFYIHEPEDFKKILDILPLEQRYKLIKTFIENQPTFLNYDQVLNLLITDYIQFGAEDFQKIFSRNEVLQPWITQIKKLDPLIQPLSQDGSFHEIAITVLTNYIKPKRLSFHNHKSLALTMCECLKNEYKSLTPIKCAQNIENLIKHNLDEINLNGTFYALTQYILIRGFNWPSSTLDKTNIPSAAPSYCEDVDNDIRDTDDTNIAKPTIQAIEPIPTPVVETSTTAQIEPLTKQASNSLKSSIVSFFTAVKPEESKKIARDLQERNFHNGDGL